MRYIIFTRQFQYNPFEAYSEAHIFEPLCVSYPVDKLFAELDHPSLPLYEGLQAWIKAKSTDGSIHINFSGNHSFHTRLSNSIFELIDRIHRYCSRFSNWPHIRNLIFKIITANIGTANPKLKYCDLKIDTNPFEFLLVEVDAETSTFNLIDVTFTAGRQSRLFLADRKHIDLKVSQQSGHYRI